MSKHKIKQIKHTSNMQYVDEYYHDLSFSMVSFFFAQSDVHTFNRVNLQHDELRSEISFVKVKK